MPPYGKYGNEMPSLQSVTIHPKDSTKEIADKLLPLYVDDITKFQRILGFVRTMGRPTKPQFPEVDVKSIDPIPLSEKEAFSKKYLDYSYFAIGSPEAEERLKNPSELQYKRWKWACDNVKTYVNVLRVAGHSDNQIINMFDGIPMCFPSREDYADIRRALKKLAKDIEDDLGWSNVNFIITGSSVPGFSQNPCKGVADRPTRITSATESDVDICVVADGVGEFMLKRIQQGEKEPAIFPTTCTPSVYGSRYGIWDFEIVGKAVESFYQEWSTKLIGGLQFTFAEDDNPTPPWETRIDIDNV